MNIDKKFIISVVALFVLSNLLGFVVHGAILASDYARLTDIMRTPEEAQATLGYMLLAHVLIATGITWLYRQGRNPDKPWLGQGVRFGIGFAIASAVPIYIIYHAVAYFPLDLALKQAALETTSLIVVGITAAFINK